MEIREITKIRLRTWGQIGRLLRARDAEENPEDVLWFRVAILTEMMTLRFRESSGFGDVQRDDEAI
jgi:hypothetical protein